MIQEKSNKKIIILVIVAVSVLIIGAGIWYWFGRGAGLGDNRQSLADQKANQGFQSDSPFVGDNFTIIPPSGWVQTHIPSTLVSYQNSKETHPKGSAAEKINFKSYIAISFDNASGRTFNEIVDLVKRQVEGVIPTTSFVLDEDGTIGGQPAKFMKASVSMQNVDFKIMIVIVMKGDKYFTISNNTTAEKWSEYRDIFYGVADSFKFKY